MMQTALKSPRIKQVAWGKIWVEGYPRPFRDARIYPGGAEEWDWRETGTHHQPGIQPQDVIKLVQKGARVIVLGTGHWQNLGVCPETLELLRANKVGVHILATPGAVALYNQLCTEHPVGALIHTTC